MARGGNGNKKLKCAYRSSMDNDRNREWGPWANLPKEFAFMVLMHLGFIDYISFSCVCLSWRSLARSYEKTLLLSKEPHWLIISPCANGRCSMVSVFGERRKCIAILPMLNGKLCLGLSCGYLITIDRASCGFWLVNFVTRNELYFPAMPHTYSVEPCLFRAILVYSTMLSQYLLVAVCQRKIYVSACVDKSRRFYHCLDTKWDINDTATCKGKIYFLCRDGGSVGELRLHPSPVPKLLEVNTVPFLNMKYQRRLVTSAERLFLVHLPFATTGPIYELDFNVMEWVPRWSLDGDVLFLGELEGCVAVDPSKWRIDWNFHHDKVSVVRYPTDLPSVEKAPEQLVIIRQIDTAQPDSNVLFPDITRGTMWYFPSECYAEMIFEIMSNWCVLVTTCFTLSTRTWNW